ncbi:glutamine synthetase family protein [Gaoshiqia sediminis]|uniref:Glutamine synthetase family protein n=1 Tax=Gaoshiqia sediminis TaxID=2986998 RepID=A0AA41Y5W5_9BACT|nr:glutamine synthetase family protein [Gaoshiqia sediminis]MCW0483996.1 glutamine synthetase family protein [Gaoshiqia sediminis]
MEKQEIIKKIEKSGHRKVRFAICDIDGILRAKNIHVDKFLEVAGNTVGYCDVVFGWDSNDRCYDNVELTGWHTGYPDKKAALDLNTFRTVPWDNGIPYFLADFDVPGQEVAACPRSLLKKIRKQGADMGYKAIFSEEFEWFNFCGTPNQLAETGYRNPQPITPGMFGYSQLRPSQHADYYNELFDLLAQFNIPLESMHTETGPGVYEACIFYDEILSAADKAVLFKSAVKEIAYRHGFVATFMAKWNEQLPGSSGHIHQSIWSSDGGKNLFFSGSPEEPMSELMESYLAGQLRCLPEILPMYAPTINSYKRLRDGAWAPTTVTWGKDNRTTAIRMISRDEKSTRLEMRVPGADSNPYLAMAASLASGLYGIRNKLKLDIPPVIGNAYTSADVQKLPANLLDATRVMANSEIANELFGEAFTRHFTQTREWEWREFARAVTDWETKRYFEII